MSEEVVLSQGQSLNFIICQTEKYHLSIQMWEFKRLIESIHKSKTHKVCRSKVTKQH